MLRLAGVDGTQTMVPTLAQQMAASTSATCKATRLRAACWWAGRRCTAKTGPTHCGWRYRRGQLPSGTDLLIGEADAVGCEGLQHMLGALMCGSQAWPTLRVPKPLATASAWVQAQLEPVVADAIDGGSVCQRTDARPHARLESGRTCRIGAAPGQGSIVH